MRPRGSVALLAAGVGLVVLGLVVSSLVPQSRVLADTTESRDAAARAIFTIKCVACHKADGSGGVRLTGDPTPDWSDPKTWDDPKRTDEYLRDRITNGTVQSGCIAWGKSGQLTPQQIEALVVFIRTAFAPPRSVSAAMSDTLPPTETLVDCANRIGNDNSNWDRLAYALVGAQRLSTPAGLATFYLYSNQLDQNSSHAMERNLLFVRMPSGAFYDTGFRVANGELGSGAYLKRPAIRLTSSDMHSGVAYNAVMTIYASGSGLRFVEKIHNDEDTPKDRTDTGTLKLTPLPSVTASDPTAELVLSTPGYALTVAQAKSAAVAFVAQQGDARERWQLTSFSMSQNDLALDKARGSATIVRYARAPGGKKLGGNLLTFYFQRAGGAWRLVKAERLF